jgi:hypothetical protein
MCDSSLGVGCTINWGDGTSTTGGVRREVIRQFRAAASSGPSGEPRRFAISYQDMRSS